MTVQHFRQQANSSSFNSSSPNSLPSSTLNSAFQAALNAPMLPAVTNLPGFDPATVDPADSALAQLRQMVGAVDQLLRLPHDARTFALFIVGLMLVFGGALTQVWLSAQIMQAKVQLVRLDAEFYTIEQQNGDIIFDIARLSSLPRLKEQIIALGYVPVQAREYVVVETPILAVAPTIPAIDPVAAASTAVAPNQAPSLRAAIAGNVAESSFWGQNQMGQWQAFFGFGAMATTAVAAPQPSTAASERSWQEQWQQRWQQTLDQGGAWFEQLTTP